MDVTPLGLDLAALLNKREIKSTKLGGFMHDIQQYQSKTINDYLGLLSIAC